MEILVGLMCLAFACLIPLWLMSRFTAQRQRFRLLATEDEALRDAIRHVERTLMVRIEALEAELRRRPMMAGAVPTMTPAPVEKPVVRSAAKTTFAPIAQRSPPPVFVPPPLPEAPAPVVEPPQVAAPQVAAPQVEPAQDTVPEVARETEVEPELPRKRGMEQSLVWIVAAVGGLAVLLSGLIFFATTLASGAIPPAVRVLAGLAMGGGGLVLGEWLWRRQSGGPAAAISGAGAGLLYGALYASAIRYDLVPIELAFLLMCGVTALTAWRADAHRSALLAGMAGLAGFATPLMLSMGENRPILLIGYLALLSAGLLVSATRQQWKGLIAGSGVLTLLMLSGWAIRFLTPQQLPIAVIGAGLLAAVYLVAAGWRSEPGEADRISGIVGALMGGAAPVFLLLHGGDPLLLAGVLAVWIGGATVLGAHRDWPELSHITGWLAALMVLFAVPQSAPAPMIISAMLLAAAGLVAAAMRREAAGLALPALMCGFIAAGVTVASPLSDTPLLLIELIALTGLAGLTGHRRGLPWLLDLTGVALLAFISLSGTPLLTGGVLAVMAGTASLRIPRAGLWAPMLGAAGMALPLVLGSLPPLALLYLLGLAGLGAGLAHRLKSPMISLETAGLVGGLQIMAAATGLVEGTLTTAVILLAPPILSALSTRRNDAIVGSYLATLIAGGLLIFNAPALVLVTPAVLGIALAMLAPATLPMAVLYGTGILLAVDPAPGVALVLGWGLYLAALALPSLKPGRIVSQSAILAGGVLFLPMHLSWQALTDGLLSGLQPALVAGLTLAAAIRTRQQGDRTGLAEIIVLGFATAAIPMQLQGPWVVLGLAVEVLALAELQRREPLPLLRYGAVGLAGVVCAMLLNPGALQWSHNPLIWVLPAAALLWSGERLRTWRRGLSQMVQLGGAILLFAAVDLSILGLFGGHGLRLDSVAGEMVRSLAWAGFGLAGMGTGVKLRRQPVRMTALVFLCIAAGKVFLSDLWQLHGLVRVGSIMGLGVFLLGAAILLQKVVLMESDEVSR